MRRLEAAVNQPSRKGRSRFNPPIMNHRENLLTDPPDVLIKRTPDHPPTVHEEGLLRASLLSPARLLQEIIARYHPMAAQKDLEFKVAPYPDWHDVVVDESKVRQLVFALLDNAIAHTSAGWVRLEFRPPNGQHWGFVIEDTGSGVAAGEAVRVHQLPTTASRPATSGYLENCRELAERLRGTILIHSQLGKGLRVEVKLPVMVT